MTISFDNHPAFDTLSAGFESMDRDLIVEALRELDQAAVDSRDRQALGELGTQALQRLGLLNLAELPENVDREAVAEWTVQVARDLLHHGALVDGSEQEFNEGLRTTWSTPLALAAEHENWALAQVLVEGGADPRAAFPTLSLAAQELDAEAMAYVLSTIDHHPLPPAGKSILVQAKGELLNQLSEANDQLRAVLVVRALAESTPSSPDAALTTARNDALVNAFCEDNWDMVLELVRQGANLLSTTDDGTRVIDELIQAPPDIVIALLDHVTGDMLPSNFVRDVLIGGDVLAAWTDEKRAFIAQRAIGMGQAAPLDGMTLVRLAEHKRPLCAAWLLEAGVDRAFTTTKEIRAMIQVSTEMDGAARQVVPGFRSRVHHGYTALHAAAKHGHVQVVDVLLKAGMAADAATDEGVTPIHLAALSGNAAAVERLIKAGVAFDVPDAKGRSPQHWALKGSSAETVLQNVYRVLREQEVLQDVLQGVATTVSIDDPKGPRPRL